MSNREMNAFINDILSKKIFHCAYCNNILKTPVILVENVGNTCFFCFEKIREEKDCIGLHNAKLESVLNELKLPCRFQANGCQEWVPYSDLNHHEHSCKYFIKNCKSLTNFDCDWEGVLEDFWGHFRDKHPDHCIPNGYYFDCGDSIYSNQQNRNVKCKIDVNVNDNCQFFKLLNCKEPLILKMKFDKETSILKYILFNNSNNETAVNVKYYGCNQQNLLKTKVQLQQFKKLYHKADLEYTQLDLNTLKEIIEIHDKLTIEIKLITNDKHELDSKMLQYFECPVCKNLMKPPIYQCNFGHSICNTCKPKLEKCPTCRGIFANMRNYNLEGLTSSISYPCQFQYLGCNETAPSNEINKHEEFCYYKSCSCPSSNCGFVGNSSTLIPHLKHAHRDKVILEDTYRTTVDFRQEPFMDFYETNRFFMVFDEKVFRLSFKRNSDYCFWAVECLQGNSENFIYEIGITDIRKPNRKLIRTDDCFKGMNMEDIFKKSILFPNNILSSYCSGGNLSYYCKVYRS